MAAAYRISSTCGLLFTCSTAQGFFFRKQAKKKQSPDASGRSPVHLLTCSRRSRRLFRFQLLFFGVPMAFMFENLDVYQNAVNLADKVLVATSEFPRGFYFLSDQLNRACVSIATNLAEGNGRFTIPDRKNFFMIARGSVQECVALMEIALRRKLITVEAHVRLRSDLEEIAKMLSGLINGLDNRKA